MNSINHIESSEFRGKNCLITGGLGLIGRKLTDHLANLGANVIVLDIKNKPKSIRSNIKYYKIDLAFQDSSAELIKELVSEIQIHHLFNCVSLKSEDSIEMYKSFENYDFELWRKIIEINTTSVAKICSLIGKEMIKNNFGTIVNFASIYGASMGTDQRIYDGIPTKNYFNTPAIYPVSKGGIVALTKHLATLWGEFNIRVNAISPGGVYNYQDESFVKAYSNRVPMNRMATVEEIVFPAVFLSSQAASYINGHELFVDGGLHAW